MNLFALITSKLRSLPPKHCAVAVGVLEGAVAVRDDEGHPLGVEQDQVRAQELLQPLLGAELRPAHRHAPPASCRAPCAPASRCRGRTPPATLSRTTSPTEDRLKLNFISFRPNIWNFQLQAPYSKLSHLSVKVTQRSQIDSLSAKALIGTFNKDIIQKSPWTAGPRAWACKACR